MKMRKYQLKDCEKIAELFYQTVHAVNVKDYTREQLNVWATGSVDLEAWNQSFLAHETVVAVMESKKVPDGQETIVGFGDIDVECGYLDRLYVHKDYQGQGIASAICDALEAFCGRPVTTHASITARPFFENRGYHVVKEQQVERQGKLLTNYVMISGHAKKETPVTNTLR